MRVLGKETRWEGRFLRTVLISYDVRCSSSGEIETRDWEAVERINCGGIVGIVPFTDAGEVLLIRQFRPPINGYVIELPAGLVDGGESFEAAARRELIEETGYAARDLHFLTEGPMSSGASAEILTVYVAKGVEHVGVGEQDETENIEVIATPINNLPERLEAFRKAGNRVDLKVFGLIELARRFLKTQGKDILHT